MFEGIRNRLGFGSNDDFDQEFEDDYNEYADNFDDFSGYDDDENSYSPYAPVTVRDSSERSYNNRYGQAGSSGSRGASHPRLVSFEEVRASTQIPESLNRDPLPARRSSAGRSNDYLAQANGESSFRDTSDSFAASDSHHTSGYDSLFSPTAAPAPVASNDTGASYVSQSAQSDSYDPYRAYENGIGAASFSAHRPTRRVTVIAPSGYSEVENVARMLRAGDVVILSLKQTPSELSKRVLDFSFGVASALNASVDCVADKVFAITQGDQLTDAERMRLRNQGVL